MNKHNIEWNKNFELAKDFFENNGDIFIFKNNKNNNIKLRKWIYRQRDAYKKGKLSQEQIALLESIGMVWDGSDRVGSSFPEYFIYYYFKSIYGEDKVFYRDKSLGFELDVYIPHLKIGIEFDGKAWHNDEKDIIKDLKAHSEGITLYRIREIGLNNLETSNCFYLTNSCSNIQRLTKEIYDIFSKEFKITIEFLFQEVYNEYIIKSLNTSIWDEKFKLAQEFYDKNRHLKISRTYKINNINLGKWISHQRQAYKKGTLSYSQIDKLNSIGMIWEVNHYKKRAA